MLYCVPEKTIEEEQAGSGVVTLPEPLSTAIMQFAMRRLQRREGARDGEWRWTARAPCALSDVGGHPSHRRSATRRTRAGRERRRRSSR